MGKSGWPGATKMAIPPLGRGEVSPEERRIHGVFFLGPFVRRQGGVLELRRAAEAQSAVTLARVLRALELERSADRLDRQGDVDESAEGEGGMDDEVGGLAGDDLFFVELPDALDAERGRPVLDVPADPADEMLAERRRRRLPSPGLDAARPDDRPGPEQTVVVEVVGRGIVGQDLAVEAEERMDVARADLLRIERRA